MRYPYQQLEDDWKRFEKSLSETEEIANGARYTPIAPEIKHRFDIANGQNEGNERSRFDEYFKSIDGQYCFEIINTTGFHQNKRYCRQLSLNEYGNDDFEKSTFIYPNRYALLDPEEALRIAPPLVALLDELTAPKIQLGKHLYPDSYLTPDAPPAWFAEKYGIKEPTSYLDRDIIVRTAIVTRLEAVAAKLSELRARCFSDYKTASDVLFALARKYETSPELAIAELIEVANQRNFLPDLLRTSLKCKTIPEDSVIYMECTFPDYSGIHLIKREGRQKNIYYVGSEKENVVRSCLYSVIIRQLKIAEIVSKGLFKKMALNVISRWNDPATGQLTSGIIASVLADVETISNIDTAKLEPEACFKYLKGLRTPLLSTMSAIRPIMKFNLDDNRIVPTIDVIGSIVEGENIAEMDWEDFEHLVAQILELEFASQGIVVKVTQASRDRGVDALLFDPNPLRGGKYVVQAKRYTRTVEVAAVRDLYGTILNEGANRGILITTSSYGPDAYEFAKDKPISLIDGQNLLALLNKHNMKYRIDIDEARRRFVEDYRLS